VNTILFQQDRHSFDRSGPSTSRQDNRYGWQKSYG